MERKITGQPNYKQRCKNLQQSSGKLNPKIYLKGQYLLIKKDLFQKYKLSLTQERQFNFPHYYITLTQENHLIISNIYPQPPPPKKKSLAKQSRKKHLNLVELANFFLLKGQMLNIFSFAGHLISVALLNFAIMVQNQLQAIIT